MKKNVFLKSIAVGMAICTIALGLIGCGNSKNSDTASAPAATTNSENEATETNDVTKPSSPVRISLGTSSSGGNFYLVGGGIATILNNSLGDYVTVTAEETGGSTANLTMIESGEAEIGISMCSAMYSGIQGTADWLNGEKMENVRGMIPLYPSYMTIYGLKSSGINTLSDMNGKIIGLGSKGAAMDAILREALPMLGVTPKDIFNDGHAATATAVSQGTVDEAILFAFPPFSAITELEASNDLTFVGLTEDEQKTLVDAYPFYTVSSLPAGSYKAVTEDIPTVSEWNMLVCSKELDEDYVYLMVKTLFEQNEEMQKIHGSLMYATAENCKNFNIPLHAGVVRYLKEQGVDVPAELIPEEYKD